MNEFERQFVQVVQRIGTIRAEQLIRDMYDTGLPKPSANKKILKQADKVGDAFAPFINTRKRGVTNPNSNLQRVLSEVNAHFDSGKHFVMKKDVIEIGLRLNLSKQVVKGAFLALRSTKKLNVVNVSYGVWRRA